MNERAKGETQVKRGSSEEMEILKEKMKRLKDEKNTKG